MSRESLSHYKPIKGLREVYEGIPQGLLPRPGGVQRQEEGTAPQGRVGLDATHLVSQTTCSHRSQSKRIGQIKRPGETEGLMRNLGSANDLTKSWYYFSIGQ